MSLNFRIVLNVCDADSEAAALDTARQQFRCWLRDKQLAADDLSSGRHRVGPDATLLVSEAYPADGSRTLRLQLRETRHPHRWITTLTAHRSTADRGEGRAWLWLDNEVLPLAEDAPQPRSSTPRLVGMLLDTLQFSDHGVLLTRCPTTVQPADVEDLLATLLDPDRQIPVVVISHYTGQLRQAWEDAVDQAIGGRVGIARMYRLTPLASDLLNEGLGKPHRVWGGALRSYLPGVEPGDPIDAQRHRVLSSLRLLESPARARHLLATPALRRALARPLPPPLADLAEPAAVDVNTRELAATRLAGQDAVPN